MSKGKGVESLWGQIFQRKRLIMVRTEVGRKFFVSRTSGEKGTRMSRNECHYKGQ